MSSSIAKGPTITESSNKSEGNDSKDQDDFEENREKFFEELGDLALSDVDHDYDLRNEFPDQDK